MAEAPSDWDLVNRIRAGDDRAFDALMERHKRPVLGFVYRLLGNPTDAGEVAQDTFVRAYKAIRAPGSRFRQTDAAFSTWLFQVARHAALDVLRHRRRHPTEPLAAIEETGAALATTPRTPRDEASAHDTGAEIAAAVALLPEDQRTALILAEYEDRGYAEIAGVLGCSAKSVESRLYRAHQFLRRRLAHLLG